MLEENAPITELLEQAADGDREAASRVFSLVYGELRRLAALQRRRVRSGETLDTTAVVHEAYLRLVDRPRISWNGRRHFYCTAARSMRDVLVDEARRKRSLKRGGESQTVTLDEAIVRSGLEPDTLVALDATLEKLERVHPDEYQIVMLRYFAGLGVEEIADVMNLSRRTVHRKWRFSKAWLAKELDV